MEVVVDNISKRYGKVEALRGVSFAVKPGELLDLLVRTGQGRVHFFVYLLLYCLPMKVRLL